jgi:hypothetical protein
LETQEGSVDKSQLVEAVENGRDQLLVTLEGLSDEAQGESGVVGDWSVKDILAHISRWEAELISMLFQAQRGLQPGTAQFSGSSTDELNAKWYKESKDRPLDRVWSDFDGVHEQILRRLDDLTDADLYDTNRFTWLRGKTLASYMASDSYEHEAEHAEQIRAWRKTRGV